MSQNDEDTAKQLVEVVRKLFDRFSDGELRVILAIGGILPVKDRPGMLDQLIARLVKAL